MSTAVLPALPAKKSNHRANVIRIAEIKKHSNADSLGLVEVGGYQLVVRLDNYKVGDLAIHIQPDSLVPQDQAFAFLWEGKGYVDGDYIPEKYRRITVRRFRKEYSEGLLMPLTDFFDPSDIANLEIQEGEDLADAIGITHYEPPEPLDRRAVNQKKIWPRSLKGWWYWFLDLIGLRPNGNVGGRNEYGPKLGRPVYDIEALKNYRGVMVPGEPVVVTEKIHGSNARFVFEDGKMFVGSRQLWKNPAANCVWRDALDNNPSIEAWCRDHPGYTLYGEVVPTQKGFSYGCSEGKARFFLFDILRPDGEWEPWTTVRQVNTGA